MTLKISSAVAYTGQMRRIVLTCSACACLALPGHAEEPEGGLSLMERGAQMLMEGMLRELEPALEDLQGIGPSLRDFAQEMGPALGQLLDEVRDWSAYHPPEILPNGDIIIRRKEPKSAKKPQGETEI